PRSSRSPLHPPTAQRSSHSFPPRRPSALPPRENWVPGHLPAGARLAAALLLLYPGDDDVLIPLTLSPGYRRRSAAARRAPAGKRSEEHTSELQSCFELVCRLLLEKKKKGK